MKTILSTSQVVALRTQAENHGEVPRKKPRPAPPELLTLSSRLTYARERGKLTKAALAKAAGMDAPAITRLEQGERAEGIEAATIIRLARALKVPVGWLAADEGDPGPIPVFREAGDRRRRDE
jgi:transcriptional regulator with XRE-family HTH domain